MDAGRVAFDESSQWHRHPVPLAATHRTVQAVTRAGQRLRMIGESWWTACLAQQSMEWARYESMINAALAWANVTLVCTYDTRVLVLVLWPRWSGPTPSW